MQPGEASLHDPALGAEPRPVLLAAASDQWLDTSKPEFAAVLVVVIPPVGEQTIGALSGPTDLAGDRRNTIDQGQQLGDVIAVAARQRDRKRQPTSVCQQVVL